MYELTSYAAFLVRLWRTGEPGQPRDIIHWQGEVVHIQSSQRWTVDALDELLAIFQQQMDRE